MCFVASRSRVRGLEAAVLLSARQSREQSCDLPLRRQHTVIESLVLVLERTGGVGRCWSLGCDRRRAWRGGARGVSVVLRCMTSVPKLRCWRSLNPGATQVFLQATNHWVSCPEHGVVMAAVPWGTVRVAV